MQLLAFVTDRLDQGVTIAAMGHVARGRLLTGAICIATAMAV